MPHNTEHPVPELPAEIMPFHSKSEASTDVGTSSASEFEDCAGRQKSINKSRYNAPFFIPRRFVRFIERFKFIKRKV